MDFKVSTPGMAAQNQASTSHIRCSAVSLGEGFGWDLQSLLPLFWQLLWGGPPHWEVWGSFFSALGRSWTKQVCLKIMVGEAERIVPSSVLKKREGPSNVYNYQVTILHI